VNTFLVRSLVGDFGSMLCLFEFNWSPPFKMLHNIMINPLDICFVNSLLDYCCIVCQQLERWYCNIVVVYLFQCPNRQTWNIMYVVYITIQHNNNCQFYFKIIYNEKHRRPDNLSILRYLTIIIIERSPCCVQFRVSDWHRIFHLHLYVY